jgi:hypothetical protein
LLGCIKRSRKKFDDDSVANYSIALTRAWISSVLHQTRISEMRKESSNIKKYGKAKGKKLYRSLQREANLASQIAKLKK